MSFCHQCGSARCANPGRCPDHGTPVDHETDCQRCNTQTPIYTQVQRETRDFNEWWTEFRAWQQAGSPCAGVDE